jgi:hypothetical protein
VVGRVSGSPYPGADPDRLGRTDGSLRPQGTLFDGYGHRPDIRAQPGILLKSLRICSFLARSGGPP